jgi:hypothetical protein
LSHDSLLHAEGELSSSALQMQPTFQFIFDGDADQVSIEMRDALETREFQTTVISKGRCIDFSIELQSRRFWSPHLSVQLNEADEGTLVFGRFAPRPEIWAAFMGVYAIMSFTIFGSLILGFAQWSLKTTPWALIFPPIGLCVITLLHVASKFGQRLSRDQIELLRSRFDEVWSLAIKK